MNESGFASVLPLGQYGNTMCMKALVHVSCSAVSQLP